MRIVADAGVTAFVVHSSDSRTGSRTSDDAGGTCFEHLTISSAGWPTGDVAGWGDDKSVRQRNFVYALGARRRRSNDNRYYEECIGAGTTEDTDTVVWSDRLGSIDTVDGGVTWRARVHSGILAFRRCFINDVTVSAQASEAFANAAITLHGAQPINGVGGDLNSNVSGSAIRRVRTYGCGVGINILGRDASACYVENCDVAVAGNNQSGTGGVGFSDSPQLGNTYVACQVGYGTGRPYDSPNDNTFSVFLGCYSEAGMPGSKVRGLVLGGNHGSHFDVSSQHVGYDDVGYGVWRSMGMWLVNHPKKPKLLLDDQQNDALSSWFTNDDTGYAVCGDRYEHGSSDPKGWMIRSVGGVFNRRITGYSLRNADEGPGHFREFRGEFRGDDTAPYYLGVASDSETDRFVRVERGVGGHFKVGDRFERPGSSIGEVVVTEGWATSDVWAPNTSYAPYDYYTPQASPVGGGKPGWSVQPTTPNGFTYACAVFGTTAADAAHEPAWPTRPVGGGGIAPYRWHPSWQRKIGDYGSPATPNGHYYKVTAVASPDPNGFGTGAGSPPRWNTGTTPTVDGNLTWTDQGAYTAGVHYVIDNGTPIPTEWICIGPVPTFDHYGVVGAQRGSSALSLPYRKKSVQITPTAGAGSTTTLTAAQYECPHQIVNTSANGQIIVGPNVADADVWVKCAGSGASLTYKVAGQTGVTIASGKWAHLWHNGTDYERMTLDAS